MPQHYVAHKTIGTLSIDGKANEESWQKARWTNYFVDIEGDKKPRPHLSTRVKMLWDSSHFYFYASIQEPHVWATLKNRDDVIFRDNDFEIFIDPDGDTHNYLEYEVNALNTIWDLLLTRPYRNDGHAINSMDIKGLESAVNIEGTINDPSDEDKGWSVEVAIPWTAFVEFTKAKAPPSNGHQWRVNFSRVQWETEIIEGTYVKKKDPETGKNQPEKNWVWSPQRVIAMHEPEFWGVVSFSSLPVGGPRISIGRNQEAEEIRQLLYNVHRAQISFKKRNQVYASSLEELEGPRFRKSNGQEVKIDLNVADHQLTYEASVFLLNKGWWRLDETGRLWFEKVRK